MADYTVTGNKTVKCRHCNKICSISFQETICKCPHCGEYIISPFFGAFLGKNGNYVH